MRKPVGRNTKKPAPKPQDEMVTILQDISATLDAILKLLEEELENDEPEQPATVPQQPQGPV